MADNFGERAATTAELSAWVTLVRAGYTAASSHMRVNDENQRETDSMRPAFGSNQASREQRS